MSSQPSKSLTELAKEISDAAAEIANAQTEPIAAGSSSENELTKASGPSGKASTSSRGVTDAKERLLSAVAEMQAAAMSPQDFLLDLLFRIHDYTALSIVIEFGIATAVPLEGDISFPDLAKKVGIGANSLERVMRLLFLHKFFCEPRPGYVGHSRFSALLAQQPGVVSIFRHLTTAGFRGGSYLAEALRKFPDSSKSTETGFPLAYGSSEPFFAYLAKDPSRAADFNRSMVGVNTLLDRSPRDDIDSYDWTSLGENATVVDLGGGNGHIALTLIFASPNLSIIVQDLPEIINHPIEVPSALQSRLSFEAHDFFHPQPRTDVTAFYIRHIVHNWSDEQVVAMLQALIPALKNGTRILIRDNVLPEAGVMREWNEKILRQLDLHMMQLLNARERSEKGLIGLLEQADPRFRFVKTWRSGTGKLGADLLEAQWIEN